MNKITKLENQLKEEKLKLEKEAIEKELAEYKNRYEGCWSTHKICRFEYPGKGFEFSLIKYFDFRIKDKTIVCKTVSISSRYSNNNYIFEISDSGYDYNIKGSSMYLYTKCQHKVSKESFEKLKQQMTAYLEKGIDNIRLQIPTGNEIITIGNSNSEETKKDLLKHGGDSLIDLENVKAIDHISMIELLSWNNHPYLIGNYLLNSQTSKKIIEKIADDIESNARSWGGSIWERDYPRIKALRQFIQNTEWK